MIWTQNSTGRSLNRDSVIFTVAIIGAIAVGLLLGTLVGTLLNLMVKTAMKY